MRGWVEDYRSYLPPVAVGERMRGYSLGRVLASKNTNVEEGAMVTAFTGWAEFAIVDGESVQPVDLPKGTKITDSLGVAGLTGLAAYFGLKYVGQPKAGEVVVISGAAGATGLVVGQICKTKGCRVIGIAGSNDKCEMLTQEFGFDVALSYKSPTFREDLVNATPNFVNVYWDGVGGDVLDMVLDQAARGARFVMCGNISAYNNPGHKSVGIQNLFRVTTQRVRMEGFIVLDYVNEIPQAVQVLGQWLAEGKIKRKETIVKGGIKVAEHAIADLFTGKNTGKNTGKLMVEIKPYEE